MSVSPCTITRFALIVTMSMVGFVQPASAVQRLVVLEEPTILPTFELEKSNGEHFALSDLKGQWNLVTIGFTTCPDICPFVLTNLNAVSKKLLALGVKPLPRVVFVSIDPYRDRPLLAEYVTYFGTNIIGVTGAHSELTKLTDGIDASYVIKSPRKSTDAQDSYDVEHSAFVALVSPEGKVVARLNPPLPAQDTAQFLLEVINESIVARF